MEAHRSLYVDGQILHQDINPSNIIIPSSDPDSSDPDIESTGGRGVLIDLDMAKENSAPYRPFQAVGTYIFQAIGVLQAYLPDNPHTHRHDLESFFHAFLFLAVCPSPVPSGENQLQLPSSSVLRQWLVGCPVDKARRKMKDMNALNFGQILNEFTANFKGLTGLAEELRLLFPIRDGEMFTGTDLTAEGTDALYDSIILAFEKAL